MTLALTAARSDAAPPPVPSPLRDAWKVATIFYPEVSAETGALVSFQTHQISVASMDRAVAGGGWAVAGPFILRVQQAAGSTGSEAPILEADVVIDREGGLRSFTVTQCQLFSPSELYALRKELTDQHAQLETIDRRLRARFAAYPPSKLREADAAFREKFRAADAVFGRISIEEVIFGASPTRDPSDETVELQWIVTGWRGSDRVVALFEPIHGRLIYLQLF